ncbi:hypothetical protein GCM10010140_56280 [Streptosporangium pseudovulgare]|uniref:Uncharacterized protein n=1 Tax=Streptosporangium pseudovulgare TaxID=35765 RepID=A0ABQ2RBR8_9ACTN|nr:hypothetical protein GCM10010140_56280 [Streptosporangium pseudovulgare]
MQSGGLDGCDAGGDRPPPLDPAFYRALESPAVFPRDTRFVAGLAHEAQDPADQRQVLNIVEGMLSRGRLAHLRARPALAAERPARPGQSARPGRVLSAPPQVPLTTAPRRPPGR